MDFYLGEVLRGKAIDLEVFKSGPPEVWVDEVNNTGLALLVTEMGRFVMGVFPLDMEETERQVFLDMVLNDGGLADQILDARPD